MNNMFIYLKKSIFSIIYAAFLINASGCNETIEDAPPYYQRAVDFMASDQSELALVELKGALHLDPGMLPALELRLELHEEQKDYAAVIETINRILELDPTHLSAILRKGELLLLAGESDRAKEPVAKALELAPDNTKAQNLQAAWFLRDGRLQAALTFSDQARSKPPIDAETYALALMIRIRMQKLDEAVSMVANALSEHPQHAALHLLRISVAHAQGRFAEVPGYYQILIDLYPSDVAYARELALFYLRENKESQAIAVMQRMVEDNPNNVGARFLLGQLLARDRSAGSFKRIESLLAEQPETSQLRFLLARLYEDSDRYGEAISHYETIAQLQPDKPEVLTARAELARIALSQGRREDADGLIAVILEQNPSHAAGLLLKAHTYLLDKKVPAATEVLRGLLRDEPDNDRALEALGRGYLMNDSRSLAMDSFKSALDANPLNTLAAKQLATLHMQDGNLTAVAEVLTPFEAAQVRDPDVERALLQVRLMLKDWRGAERLANSSQIGKNNPLFKGLVNALVLQGNQHFGASIPKLKEILAADGGNTRTVLMALITGYAGANKLEEGVRFFEQYRTQHPDKPWSKPLLFDIYIRANRQDKAMQLMEQQISSEQGTPRDFGLLARLHDEAGDQSKALAALQAGSERFPDSTVLLLSKATLLERLNQLPQAVSTYQAILTRDPRADLAANNLAVIFSREAHTLSKAHELAKRFRGTREPYFADTLGWICVLSDDLACALPLLEFSVKRMPEQAEFNYHLGSALAKANQRERAKQYLEKAAELMAAGANFPDSEALFVLLDQIKS